MTRVREIHGLDIDVDVFGATSELTFFSNEVRLHGVRVGWILRSSSKSKTDVSWLLNERRYPCVGDHWSGDVARTGDELFLSSSSFFHAYNESSSESILLFTSVEKLTRKKKLDGSKPIWSLSFNSRSISFVNWMVLPFDGRKNTGLAWVGLIQRVLSSLSNNSAWWREIFLSLHWNGND